MANPEPNKPGIRRCRLFIRDCGPSERNWRSQSSNSTGHSYALVGVAEVDDAANWQREMTFDFGLLTSGSRGHISFEGAPRALESHAATCDLPFLATDHQWARPSDVAMALGWGGGSMILRETRAPSSEGTKLCLVLMTLCLPEASLPDAHMAELHIGPRSSDWRLPGIGGFKIVGPCDALHSAGMALCQIQKAPIWGWGDEPFGFASLLRLDIVDACTELQALLMSDNANPDEIERLRRLTQGAVQTRPDKQFDEFRRRMVAEFGMTPWDDTPTASQVAIREENAARVIREMMLADA